MATLKIELDLSTHNVDAPEETLRSLADRIANEGVPSQGAFLLRDGDGAVIGQATIVSNEGA